MLEKVTVTDATAEDMEKLRPRLKNVHISELVAAIRGTPKARKPTCTCRRGRHCGQAQPRTAHQGHSHWQPGPQRSHRSPGEPQSFPARISLGLQCVPFTYGGNELRDDASLAIFLAT